MKKFLENKKLLLIILLAINIMVIGVLSIKLIYKSNNLVNYHITKADFESYTSDMNDDNERFFGGTIGGDEFKIGEFYTASPYIMWEKGYWKYTLTYTAEGETHSTIWPANFFVYSANVIEPEVITLEEGTHTVTKEVKTNADILLALKVCYQDEGNSITFEDCVIQETNKLQIRQFIIALLVMIVFDVLFYMGLIKKVVIPKETKYEIAGIVILTICASYPLFLGYVIDGHDIDFHLCRIEGIKEALLSGQFPARMNSAFEMGYGYADLIFYGNIFLYIPALLRLLEISLGDTYLIYIGMITFATVLISQYFFGKIFKNKWTAYVVTFLYVMAPYRLVDVYLRASVGEYSAMTFLPMVVYGMYRIYSMDKNDRRYNKSFIILSLALTGIMQTHILTGEMLCIFIFITCIVLIKDTLQLKRFIELVKTVICTLLLNIWFIVPFLDFRTERIKIFTIKSIHLLGGTCLYLFQLIQMFPQYAVKNLALSSGSVDEMYCCLGLAIVIGMILCAVMLWVNKYEKTNLFKYGLFVLFLAVTATFMTTIYFPWDTIHDRLGRFGVLVSNIQFAWRFLGFASIFGATASAVGIAIMQKKEKVEYSFIAGTVLILITFISGIYYMQVLCLNHPEINEIKEIDPIVSCYAISGSEYSIVLPDEEGYVYEFDPYTKDMPLEPVSDDVEITNYTRSGTNHKMTVKASENGGTITLPLFCYKGYKVKSADKVITTDNLVKKNTELWYLEIPAGYSGEISISYEGFWYWRVAEAISAISFILMIAYAIISSKKEKKQQ